MRNFPTSEDRRASALKQLGDLSLGHLMLMTPFALLAEYEFGHGTPTIRCAKNQQSTGSQHSDQLLSQRRALDRRQVLNHLKTEDRVEFLRSKAKMSKIVRGVVCPRMRPSTEPESGDVDVRPDISEFAKHFRLARDSTSYVQNAGPRFNSPRSQTLYSEGVANIRIGSRTSEDARWNCNAIGIRFLGPPQDLKLFIGQTTTMTT